MGYTHTTFTQFKTALAGRLGDTTNAYWTDTECGLYVIEALRTWGLITGYWRDSGTFNTTSGTGFYDITTLQNSTPDNLLSQTVTDTDLSTLIQYHLLEPPTGSTWTGSEQFTLADITNSLTKRRDAFLVETGAYLTSFTQVLPAGAQTFDLPDTTVKIENVRWTGVSGTDWPLSPEDISSQRNFSSSYLLTQGAPQTYSASSVQPLRYVITPPTNEPGTLRALIVQSGATLTAGGVTVGVPDDMAWVVKWGALADMLGKEGPGQDLPRSYFCERRWGLGLALAKIYPTVINAQLNGVSLSPDSLDNLDRYSPNWYSSTGTPTFVSSMRNYVAASPAPNGIFSILLDVVRKAIVPSANSDYIQLGREYLDPVLDYAEHLAAFKCGGYEFKHSYRGAENFFNAALSYNQRLAATHPAITELIKQSTMLDYTTPPKRDTSGTQMIGNFIPKMDQ